MTAIFEQIVCSIIRTTKNRGPLIESQYTRRVSCVVYSSNLDCKTVTHASVQIVKAAIQKNFLKQYIPRIRYYGHSINLDARITAVNKTGRQHILRNVLHCKLRFSVTLHYVETFHCTLN